MAFPQPNLQRELASRKILEELQQQKKQLLLKQGVASSLNSSLSTVIGSSNSGTFENHSNAMQRSALQQANAQSMGNFITQDSSFVLRRKMFPCMKLRHLEELFQCIDEFEKPNIKLEQYVTPPHLASHMLFTIQSQYGDITEKQVADLGAGCGSLAIGAAALSAGHVVGFEIDETAIKTFENNLQEQELTNVDLILCDVTTEISDMWSKKFDTVIMNPPFGTKHNAGIDMVFLKKAIEICSGVVYSLHKSSTRSHVLKVAAQCGAKGEVLAQLRYNLSSTYKFHKKKSVDIEVDFFRFEVQPSSK